MVKKPELIALARQFDDDISTQMLREASDSDLLAFEIITFQLYRLAEKLRCARANTADPFEAA